MRPCVSGLLQVGGRAGPPDRRPRTQVIVDDRALDPRDRNARAVLVGDNGGATPVATPGRPKRSSARPSEGRRRRVAAMSLTWFEAATVTLIAGETAALVWLLRHRAVGSRSQRLLADRLRFETLLSDLSAKLVHVDADGLDAALEAGLRQIVSFLGVDRGNLDEYVGDAPGVRVSWAEPGIQHLPSILAAGQFEWTAATLRPGSIVRFARIDELPPQAATDRASYERLGTRSHPAIPLQAGGPMLGVLSFDAVRAERDWPDDFVER